MDAENVVDGGIRHRFTHAREALETMNITRPDAPKGFVTRLAEENGWTMERAQAAEREYRRFLILASITTETIVPSKDVDAAWHEHLLHTRHYWDATCRDILGRPFHHDPGDGGPADAAMHERGYRRTLELYERTFGEPAPTDVWPRGCGCTAAPAGRTAEVELAMPAWTLFAAAAVAIAMFVRGAIGDVAALAFAALAAAAWAVRGHARLADIGPETRVRASTRRQGAETVAMIKRGNGTRSDGRPRTNDGWSGTSDEVTTMPLWTSDPGPSVHHDAHCTPSPSTTHDGGSHSSHSCGGSSHSCGGHSCGGSSCGGGGCGGGGCGGS